MKTTVVVVFNEIELEVCGNYSAGSLGDYEYPPESSDFEIISVKLVNHDDNLVDLFYNGVDYDSIIDECIQTIEEAI